MKKLFCLLLALTLGAMGAAAMAEGLDMSQTYCNPLNLPVMDVSTMLSEMPGSLDGLLDATSINETLAKDTLTAADARSLVRSTGAMGNLIEDNARTAADVFAYQVSDGTIYLYATGNMQDEATYGACWSTTDYINWEYHQMNLGVVAPTFVQVGEKYYFAGNNTPVYVSDSPVGPWEELGYFQMPDGTGTTGFGDVNFFLDDDGRLYLTYSIGSPIMGCELDPEDPTKMLTEPVALWYTQPSNEWERFGSGNQNSMCGYTEGSQIIKYNGVYYLQAATNGTENISYCIGIKKSTEGPLSGYGYQQNNPVTYDVDNFIPGVGHGCFLVDADGNIVLFYTSCISREDGRRVGMDLCYVDENGDIVLPEATDTPQLAPNLATDAGTDIGLACLTNIGGGYWASSYAEGRSPFYATDDTVITWWAPAEDDEAPSLAVGLKSVFDVYAIQTNWKELGTGFTRNNAVQYTIEYFDLETNSWQLLVDKGGNTVANAIEYDVIDGGVRTIAIRLNILGSTDNARIGVLDLRVFGENSTLAQEKGLWDLGE